MIRLSLVLQMVRVRSRYSHYTLELLYNRKIFKILEQLESRAHRIWHILEFEKAYLRKRYTSSVKNSVGFSFQFFDLVLRVPIRAFGTLIEDISKKVHLCSGKV